MRKRSTNGFTLIEVALAIAVLAAGSTACIAMFITGLRWATDAKINATAPLSAQAICDTPQLFSQDSRNTGPFTYTTDSEGWINNYFAVRQVSNLTPINDGGGNPSGGYICDVDVIVFHGGDNLDGEAVYSMKRTMHFRAP